MTTPRVQLKVENFGPIVEGTVEFKPLTFLIGPNNSGKTYVATLLYALSKALGQGGITISPGESQRLEAVLDYLQAQALTGADAVEIEQLPEAYRQEIHRFLRYFKDQTSELVLDALAQYLSVSELHDLIRSDRTSSRKLRIESMVSDAPAFSIELSENEGRITYSDGLFKRIKLSDMGRFGHILTDPGALSLVIAFQAWLDLIGSAGFHDSSNEYYLPGARSGLLESWPLMASLSIRSASRGLGRQQLDIAPLPGIVGDFLQVIVERFLPSVVRNGRVSKPNVLRPVLDTLEGKLLRGKVVVDVNNERPGTSELTYESQTLRLPLQRVSSMIAELASIDLWVRELVEPGDLLIIDEPESHLHPENQRLIARVLVRLANAGVDVVAPTHSSTILHQVSNMLIASTLDEATRTKLGYSEADLISPDDVAVYLFEQRTDGTHIVPVPIEPGFGISEDEFVRVAEAIGDETFRLSFAAAHQPA